MVWYKVYLLGSIRVNGAFDLDVSFCTRWFFFVDLVLSIDMKLSDVLNHFFDLKLLSLLVHSIRLVLSNIMVHSLMVILSLDGVHS